MITSNLLQIVPLELQFPFIPPAPNVVLEKKSSCSMRLTNEYDYHVAFQVKSSGTSKFEISPHQGVLLPYSTANVTIKLEQPVPLDMDCTDEFSINSVVVAPGFTENDINEDTFITKSGNWIEKCVLKAVYMPTEKEGIDEENSNDHESSVNQTSETNLTISKTFNELQIL